MINFGLRVSDGKKMAKMTKKHRRKQEGEVQSWHIPFPMG